MDDKVTSLVNHDEIDRFEENVKLFLDGKMDGERFMAFRLQHGSARMVFRWCGSNCPAAV